MFNYFAVTFNFVRQLLTTCAWGHMKKFLRGGKSLKSGASVPHHYQAVTLGLGLVAPALLLQRSTIQSLPIT